MNERFWIIFGMMAVTCIPRLLSAVLLDKMHFGARFERFLQLIPYTAMTALVFPGVFTIDAARPEIGTADAAVAGILAWRKAPLMVCAGGGRCGRAAVSVVRNPFGVRYAPRTDFLPGRTV